MPELVRGERLQIFGLHTIDNEAHRFAVRPPEHVKGLLFLLRLVGGDARIVAVQAQDGAQAWGGIVT